MDSLNSLLKSRFDTEAKLAAVEARLYSLEGGYLREMHSAGHEGPLVLKGLDSYLGIRTNSISSLTGASLSGSRRRMGTMPASVARDEERIFSKTSTTVSASLSLHSQLEGYGDEEEEFGNCESDLESKSSSVSESESKLFSDSEYETTERRKKGRRRK